MHLLIGHRITIAFPIYVADGEHICICIRSCVALAFSHKVFLGHFIRIALRQQPESATDSGAFHLMSASVGRLMNAMMLLMVVGPNFWPVKSANRMIWVLFAER